MALIEVKIPQMGEGVVEATIIKWHVKPGDTIKTDDVLCDIATDKVDSEITAPNDGTISEILHKEGDVVPVGKTIVTIQTSKEGQVVYSTQSSNPTFQTVASVKSETVDTKNMKDNTKPSFSAFLSPLVKQIVQQHQLTNEEISQINGTGIDGRITKDDVMQYIQSKQKNVDIPFKDSTKLSSPPNPPLVVSEGDRIIEMDRVRKLIAEHMIRSKQISAHVTSFVEADVTHIVIWREKNKDPFYQKYGIKLTYLPVFVQALTRSLLKYPMLNASVDEDKIMIKKNINIGIATALPNDNLIVPVLKNADQLNLLGIIRGINDLATRARENKLQPAEITGGTFSVTNLGTFGTLAGTPIINQPQVAILGIGTIQKVPSVIETSQGDMIAIRSKVILSLSYDHRIIDGMLAGKFLKYFVEQLTNISLEEI